MGLNAVRVSDLLRKPSALLPIVLWLVALSLWPIVTVALLEL